MYRRFGHGQTAEPLAARKFVGVSSAKLQELSLSNAIGLISESTPKPNTFDFLFPWTEADRLVPGEDTVAALKILGSVLKDSAAASDDAAEIPAGFTYFGQFLDHDITLDQNSGSPADLAQPLPRPGFLAGLENSRTASLELDSVYGAKVEDSRDPSNINRMRVDPVSLLGGTKPPLGPVPGKSRLNDLPRQPRSTNPDIDRAAMIGDARNDENTIVAQLHTAFLKAHNTLVDRDKRSFDEAREEMVIRFQSAVLNDFLSRVCDVDVHADVMVNGAKHWKVTDATKVFMPAEFAYAAYRFGHSMVRTQYNFNLNFPESSLEQLFLFTALSGNLNPTPTEPGEGLDHLPENWVVQWERLLPVLGVGSAQMARAIDVRLTNFLFELRDANGKPEKSHELAPLLATRNLLRGYRVGLPTGQALAARMNITSLKGNALRDALPTDAIKEAAEPFLERTPLWFYILAEAGNPAANGGPGGQRLGKLGSTILMETLHTLVKFSPISLLDGRDHGAAGTSTLVDIIQLAAFQDN